MASTVSLVGKLGHAVLDLVFPARCAVCGSSGAFLCDECGASLPWASPPRCPRCWCPGLDAPCLQCQAVPPAYDGLRASVVYAGAARELVLALKYRGMTALAAPMALILAETARTQGMAADVLVPVPLSGLRRRTRGYNQAEILARSLGRELGLPVTPQALQRRRHTPQQARSADIEERRRNVANAFVSRSADLAGRRVLLVDDVTTSGATLAACAAALREAGARSIWGLAFARED